MKKLPDIEDIIKRQYSEWKNGDRAYDWEVEAMKEYGRQVRDYTLELASKRALIYIDNGKDYAIEGYDKRWSSLTADYIRDEKYVEVDKNSILKLKKEIKI